MLEKEEGGIESEQKKETRLSCLKLSTRCGVSLKKCKKYSKQLRATKRLTIVTSYCPHMH